MRAEVLERNPQIADVLNPVSASLTTEKMAAMNKSVDIDGKEPVDVACEFLTSEGFIDSCN